MMTEMSEVTPQTRNPPEAHEPDLVIEVQDLCKSYGKTVIHKNLQFDVRRGEIVAIVGGSGSGKTTLVRQIIALERPTSGTIKVFGENINSVDAQTARLMRCRTGMLFQQGALFSAMSVFDNVAQPIRELGRVPEPLLRDIVMLKLEMVGLPFKHAYKMPAALSGGMIKRVGIARAIALEPELLFLDEPTAGLDPQSSEEFVQLIATLHRMLGLTVVMVTHDLDTRCRCRPGLRCWRSSGFWRARRSSRLRVSIIRLFTTIFSAHAGGGHCRPYPPSDAGSFARRPWPRRKPGPG